MLTLERPTADAAGAAARLCALAFLTRAQAVALVRRRARRADPARPDRARPAACACGRSRRSTGSSAAARRARARRHGRARPLAALAARRVPRRDGERLLGQRRPATTCSGTSPSSISTSASSRSPRCSRSGSRRAGSPGGARVRRRDAAASPSARRGGRRLRVGAVAAHRGAQQLLRRAARADRAARPARAATSSRVAAGRSSRRRWSPASCPVAIPFARFVTTSAISDTFGLLPWWWLQDQGIHFGPLRFVALGVGLAVEPPSCSCPGVAAVFPALVLVVPRAGVGRRRERTSRHPRRPRAPCSPAFARRTRNGSTAPSAVRRTSRSSGTTPGETRPLWNNEFFNRSVRTVYTVDGPDRRDGGLPETPVFARSDGMLATARPASCRGCIRRLVRRRRGKALARDSQIGLTLYRVDGPLVILTQVAGVYPDTWAGRIVTYHRFRCAGGTLSVRLGTDEHLFTGDQTVSAAEIIRHISRIRDVGSAARAQRRLGAVTSLDRHRPGIFLADPSKRGRTQRDIQRKS